MSDRRPRGRKPSTIPGVARHARLKKPGPGRAIAELIGTAPCVIVVSTFVITAIVLYQFQSDIGPSVNIHPNHVVFVQYPGSTGGTGIFAGKVQPNVTLGNQLFSLIKSDTPFTLGIEGDNRGSVAAPTGASATSPSATPVSGATVINGLIGQSAAQVTCSKTRPLKDQ